MCLEEVCRNATNMGFFSHRSIKVTCKWFNKSWLVTATIHKLQLFELFLINHSRFSTLRQDFEEIQYTYMAVLSHCKDYSPTLGLHAPCSYTVLLSYSNTTGLFSYLTVLLSHYLIVLVCGSPTIILL